MAVKWNRWRNGEKVEKVNTSNCKLARVKEEKPVIWLCLRRQDRCCSMSNALYNFMHCLSFSYSTFFTFLSPSPLLKNTVNFVLLASAWIAASPSLLTLLISCSFSERQRTRGLVYILYGCVCLPYPSQGMCPVASVGSGVIHRGLGMGCDPLRVKQRRYLSLQLHLHLYSHLRTDHVHVVCLPWNERFHMSATCFLFLMAES